MRKDDLERIIEYLKNEVDDETYADITFRFRNGELTLVSTNRTEVFDLKKPLRKRKNPNGDSGS